MQQGSNLSPRTRGFSLACLGLILVEGILALVWTFSQPTDPDSAFLLGYSPVRWALAAVIFLLSGLAGALGLDLLRGVERTWQRRLTQPAVFPALLAAISLAMAAAGHETLLLLASAGSGPLQAAFTRLLPLGVFLWLAAVQALLAAVPAVRARAWPERGVTRSAVLVWAGLALAGGLVLLTGLGLTPVSNGWYEYGVPLVHQQMLSLFLGALLVLLAGLAIRRLLPVVRRVGAAVDAGLILAVWLAAVILWSSMPVPNSWFSPRPFPPNYEVYPNSDALSYDAAAQGTLLGAAWARGEVHYKPLYVAFLTLLHSAAGQNYAQVIWLQTLLLALFPVALYLLGSSLHSRLAGGLAALGAILREYNQLSVASLTTLSTSKLMLSELPTALGISVLLVVLAVWLRKPALHKAGQRPYLALLAGGIIGLLIQIRLQTILFLPVLAAFLLIYYARHWRTWLGAAGLMCLGLGLSAAPLVLRNWSASGTLALEKPGYFERTLAYSYNPVSGADEAGDPGPSGAANEPQQGLGRTIEVALHHFAHNTTSAFLVLPGGLGSGLGWTRTADLQGLFWMDHKSAIGPPAAGWMMINLALLALGGVTLWRCAGWAGLLPALLFGAYNLSSALGGFSGQRFILPVDWVTVFYGAAGMAWLAAALLGLLGWNADERLPFLTQPRQGRTAKAGARRAAWWKTAAAAGILLAAGGLLPLEEAVLPVRYPAMDAGQARAELLRLAETQLPAGQLSDLQSLLDQPGSEVLHGVALYPRAIGSIEEEAGLLRYTGDRTYPLLAFVYLGSDQLWVLQPLDSTASAALPNGAEVLVAGMRGEESFRAFATARLDGDQVLFFKSDR